MTETDDIYRRILLISPDAEVAELLQNLLLKSDRDLFRVSSCKNVVAALPLFETHRFDACIIDLDIGNGPTLDPVEHLHRHQPSLPVVGVTSDVELSHSGKAIQRGAQDCLAKTILNTDILTRVVHFAIERSSSKSMLADSEARFERLIDNTPDGVLVIDAKERILFANDAAKAMLGDEGAQLLGTPFKHSVGNGFSSEIALAHNEQALFAELRMVRSTWRGEQVRVISLRDITDRKNHEQELKQIILRLTLLHHITRAIAERHDLESIFQVILSYLEDKLPVDFASLWLSDQEGGTATVMATGPMSRDRAKDMALEPGTFVNLHDHNRSLARTCRDDSGIDSEPAHETWLKQKMRGAGLKSSVIEPLCEEGRGLGWLIVGRTGSNAFSNGDVEFLKHLCEHTALAFRQKKLFKDLQKAYDALRRTRDEVMRQERLRALGQMASGIVHDINNALSPIVGYTDLLLDDDVLRTSDKGRQYLDIVRTAAGDIMDVITRMRSFYRSQEEEKTQYPVDLNQAVVQAVQLTRPRWKDIAQRSGKVVDIKTDLEDAEMVVRGLESELREAIINLIINSIDALPEGGIIRLRTFRSEDSIVLQVSDSGSGMDETTRTQCLEPFFSTKGEKGTGLGLAMVYGTVQRHKGTLEIESTPGQGTTISLSFPVYVRDDRRAKEHVASSPAPPLRILCIDDEASLRALAEDMLKQEGHRTVSAANGEDGIAAFQTARKAGDPFDVVITDFGMPYVSGMEVADRLKQVSPDTPVILLTGWDQMNVEEVPAAQNRTDFVLRKPPTLRGLRKALSHVMGWDRTHDEPTAGQERSV